MLARPQMAAYWAPERTCQYLAAAPAGRLPERCKGGIGLVRIHLAVREPDDAFGHHLTHILPGDTPLAGVFCLTDEHDRVTFPCSERPQI